MTNNTNLGRKRLAGQLIVILGFVMILANALDYLLGWDGDLMPLLVIGLVLVVSGLGLSTRR
jgi:hypothetical protein